MAPFPLPCPVLRGFQERIESLVVHGGRIYMGTATGNLHIYEIGDTGGGANGTITPIEVRQKLCKRAIDQLGLVKDINALVVLSSAEATATLYSLPNLKPATPLTKAKSPRSFAIHSSVQHLPTQTVPAKVSEGDFAQPKPVPSVVTYLVVGCQRKVVVYSWIDGEPQDSKEVSLPHSPRTTTFIDDNTVCFGYQPGFAVFHIPSGSVTDAVLPDLPAVAVSGIGGMGMGMGALSGLWSSKTKPAIVRVNDSEVLINKDNASFFVGGDGKTTTVDRVEWPAPPEETSFVKPYILSILPPGTVPNPNDSTTSIPTSVIQIRSSLSLLAVQTLPFPFNSTSPPTAADNHGVRLITPSPEARAPLFVVSTPNDRATLAAEGSTIWMLRMLPWGEQVDELVVAGEYDAALALLDTVDQAALPDKPARQTLIRGLAAVAKFRAGEFDAAMEAFTALNTNPAKVAALYPEKIAGRLATPPDEWIPLYGGPAPPAPKAKSDSTSVAGTEGPKDAEKDREAVSDTQAGQVGQAGLAGGFGRTASPMGSIKDSMKAGLDAIIPAGLKDDDAASIRSQQRKVADKDKATRMSIQSLMRHFTGRRPLLDAALGSLRITPSQADRFPALSSIPAAELLELPDAPLSALTPEQLVRFAQVVYTTLFKCYLQVNPALIGSLCRIENWCEVAEVEEELTARRKFGDLKDLYFQKRMHGKALDLLQRQGEKEDDMRDRLQPSITYLQRLGPQYLDQIFLSARWVFEQDRVMAFEIFTSEEVELPRDRVADFLEDFDPKVCARYLEYLIEEREEGDAYFHDRLAELYLKMTIAAKKRGDEEGRKEVYDKLLKFIDETRHYDTNRLFGLLPTEDLFEARAILLGRLGRHEHALELYVYRLHNYLAAEEYCKRIYDPHGPTSSAFLWLLRIYLQPSTKLAPGSNFLTPALGLVSRHGPRLDPVETLDLLPPLVTAEQAREFLMEALKTPIVDSKMRVGIAKSRDEQLARRLMALQGRRVKVTDSRICPQCHRRLGGSVIAVHAPRGEVTHYNCREAFSQRLKETRL